MKVCGGLSSVRGQGPKFLMPWLIFQSIMVKLQKLPERDSTFVTVPKDLRTAMGWEKGDQLEFTVKDSNTLEISKN